MSLYQQNKSALDIILEKIEGDEDSVDLTDITAQNYQQYTDKLLADEQFIALEKSLYRFNTFEAHGNVKNENYHSDFIAFLLSPREKHGLGDTFLKTFLAEALNNVGRQQGITADKIRQLDFKNAIVYREKYRIDIMIVDEVNNICCVIENKIYSSEHSNQLKRYHEIIEKHYQSVQFIGIYLTPKGSAPSYEKYTAFSYEELARIIDKMRVQDDKVNTVLADYTSALRRYIIEDKTLIAKCHALYEKHPVALECIREFLPDISQELAEHIKFVFNRDLDAHSLEWVTKGSRKIRVRPKEWQTVDNFGKAIKWCDSIIAIVVLNYSSQVEMRVSLYPIDKSNQQSKNIRKKIFDHALQQQDVYVGCTRRDLDLKPIYYKSIIGKRDFATKNLEALKEQFDELWTDFKENSLKYIRQDIAQVINKELKQ